MCDLQDTMQQLFSCRTSFVCLATIRADLVIAGRPLIKGVAALTANFFAALGKAVGRLYKLLLSHEVFPLQFVLHADLLAEIAANTQFRMKQ